ncbi:MAG: GDSL-type esterase/lipase family protein [Verrucomicrobia bacterium]|nr:GDSL-type esterase/lipase family protein [Verrucomicrobiota bacterium]
MKRILLFSVKTIFAAAMLFGLGLGCNHSGGGDDGPADVGDNDINVVVCIGDSITAGVGVSAAQSYPAQLSGLTGKRVVNAGITGERSGEGASRVGGLLRGHKPGFLCILFGANDVIRGGSPESIAANVRSMIQQAKANTTIPIVATITPMFGARRAADGGVRTANDFIRAVASEEGVDLVDLYSPMNHEALYIDGLHPNAAGYAIIAAKFEPQVQ